MDYLLYQLPFDSFSLLHLFFLLVRFRTFPRLTPDKNLSSPSHSVSSLEFLLLFLIYLYFNSDFVLRLVKRIELEIKWRLKINNKIKKASNINNFLFYDCSLKRMRRRKRYCFDAFSSSSFSSMYHSISLLNTLWFFRFIRYCIAYLCIIVEIKS